MYDVKELIKIFAGISVGSFITSAICYAIVCKKRTLETLDFYGFISVVSAFVWGTMQFASILLYIKLHYVLVIIISLLMGYVLSYLMKNKIQEIMEKKQN